MKKLICAIFFLIGVIIVQAQEEKKQFIHKGILRAQATISPGILLKENVLTTSIYGNLEYYVADNVSIRGDSYYFLQSENNPFEFNHSVSTGVSYHFKTKNHFDPYLAVQPGLAWSQRKSFVCDDFNLPTGGWGPCYDKTYNPSANPLISSAIGFNFYFQRVFHLFAEARYISGKHISDDSSPLSLNELRFSFGLGWNLNLIKQKK